MEDTPKLFRPLFHAKLHDDAKACQVIWAKVKGYPWWPAQVLSDAAANKKLGKPTNKTKTHEPVIFFGTLEIAWVGSPDNIDGFGAGIHAGYLTRSKQPKFIKALQQVSEFLALDKKRKAPQGWWCRAPNSGHTDGGSDNKQEEAESEQSESEEAADEEEPSTGSSSSDEEPPEEAAASEPEKLTSMKPGPSKQRKRKRPAPSSKPPAQAAPAKAPVEKTDSQRKGSSTGTTRKPTKVSGSASSSQNAPSAAVVDAGKQAGPAKPNATASGSNSQQPTSTSISKPAEEGQGTAKAAESPALHAAPPRKRSRTAAGAAAATDTNMTDAADAHAAAATTAHGDEQQGPSHDVDMQPAEARQTDAQGADAPGDALQQTSAAGPQAAAPEPPSVAASAFLMPDDDVFKLPAEIRRLAGIKLVKRERPPQHHAGEAAAASSRPKAPKIDTEVGESPKADERPTPGSRLSEVLADSTAVFGRRETRSGATPKGSAKALQTAPSFGAATVPAPAPPAAAPAAVPAAAAPVPAQVPAAAVPEVPAPAASAAAPSASLSASVVTHKEVSAAQEEPAAKDGSTTEAPEPAVAAAETAGPASPTAAEKSAARKAARQALKQDKEEPEADRLKRLDREAQLQRKRERERERRYQIKMAKLQEAAAAAAAAGSESEGDDMGGDMEAAGEGTAGTDGAADSSRGVSGDGRRDHLRRLHSADEAMDGSSRRERREQQSSPTAAAAASDSAMTAAGPFGGRPPRPTARQSSLGKPLSATQPKARSGGAGGLVKMPSDSSGGDASPKAAHKGSSIPVVSISAGIRKSTLIPPVLATEATAPPVIVQPQPARRSALLSKRSHDSGATVSDAPASDDPAGGAEAGQAALTDEQLQEEEAAEALQFMQSLGMSRDPEPAPAPVQPIPLPSPLLAQLENVLGAALSAGLTTPPLPQVYTVPRRRREEVVDFQWPQEEPVVPAVPENFYLPREWLTARPPQYEPVRKNVWVSVPRPKRNKREDVHVCQCRAPAVPAGAEGTWSAVTGCGDHCLNRSSMLHCDTKYCPCGELCSNKPFHLLRQPRVEAFLTENRGYGVRALSPIPAGHFIMEYVGEVIDEKELSRRMEAARSTAQHSYYIMELDAGQPHLYIDARYKGGLARLVNSSCSPNCETQKWHDASTGEPRVGIFAKKDIEVGEELTYDYFFEQYSRNGVFNSAFFKCMCGAPNCRGMMDSQLQMNRRNKDYGKRIEVFWDDDGIYYRGTVVGYNNNSRRHTILYDDGDQEKICLEEVAHRWIDEPAPTDQQLPSPVGLVVLNQVNASPGPLFRNGSGAGGKQAAWAAGEEAEEQLEEATTALQALRGPPEASRSIMGGHGQHSKKRSRGNTTNHTMLPPLRANLNDSYNSTTTNYSGLPHAASAPAAFGRPEGGFGKEMESLLQAVEVELGDREAQMAAAGANGHTPPHQPQHDGHRDNWHASPRRPSHHQRAHTDVDLDNGHGTHHRAQQALNHNRSPRKPPHHAQATGVRSPHRRGQAQSQQPWQPGHQHHHAQPVVAINGHHRQPQDTAGRTWNQPPQLFQPPHQVHHIPPQPAHHRQRHAAAHMHGLDLPNGKHAGHGEQRPHPLAAALPGLAGAVSIDTTNKQALIEEMLGIRISAFDVPLFQPINGGHKHVNGAQRNGMVNGLHSVLSGDLPPHLQRTPITTQAPGTAGPAPSHAAPLTGAAQLAVPGTSSGAGPSKGLSNGVQGAGPLSKVSSTMAVLLASPLLANLSQLNSKLCGQPEVSLFKQPSSNGHVPALANGNGHAGLAQHAGNGVFAMPRAISAHTPA